MFPYFLVLGDQLRYAYYKETLILVSLAKPSFSIKRKYNQKPKTNIYNVSLQLLKISGTLSTKVLKFSQKAKLEWYVEKAFENEDRRLGSLLQPKQTSNPFHRGPTLHNISELSFARVLTTKHISNAKFFNQSWAKPTFHWTAFDLQGSCEVVCNLGKSQTLILGAASISALTTSQTS